MVHHGGMNINLKVIGAFLESGGWATPLSTAKITQPSITTSFFTASLMLQELDRYNMLLIKMLKCCCCSYCSCKIPSTFPSSERYIGS